MQRSGASTYQPAFSSHSFADLAEAVVLQGDQPGAGGDRPHVADVRTGHHGVAELVVDHQELVDAHAPLVARVAASAAAGAAVEGLEVVAHAFQGLAQVARGLVALPALGAYASNQPLGEDQVQGRPDQVGKINLGDPLGHFQGQ